MGLWPLNLTNQKKILFFFRNYLTFKGTGDTCFTFFKWFSKRRQKGTCSIIWIIIQKIGVIFTISVVSAPINAIGFRDGIGNHIEEVVIQRPNHVNWTTFEAPFSLRNTFIAWKGFVAGFKKFTKVLPWKAISLKYEE